MARWAAFAGLSVVSLLLLLALARASQSYVTDRPEDADRSVTTDRPGDAVPSDPADRAGTADARDTPSRPPPPTPDPDDAAAPGERSPDPASGGPADPPSGSAAGPPSGSSADPDGRSPHGEGRASVDPHGPPEPPRGIRQLQEGPDDMGPGALALNVALSQGLFGTLLLAGVWLFAIPPGTLGLAAPSPAAVGLGVGFGLALYAANEVGSLVADSLGVGADERLRELLAPDSLRGWVVLLGFALPVAAAVEELLFRAALIGALSAGFGVSPWLLAAGSSVAFGFAHGAQGRGGVVVTGALGLALAAGFILTGSLLVVFVAHYLVNALEFLVHEGPGIELAG